ncbi:MAG TPA: serine/threonine-protein kinase [Candidatus Limnocylindrales bacterium]|nr:serine/threonine-protein kinase [Candidatus Limnocylindrales bacterium]
MPPVPQQICPKCGLPVRRIVAGGVCPSCLLETGLSEPSPEPGEKKGVPVPAKGPTLGRVGRYELFEEVAHGGMGIVYRGRDLTLNRVVALKLMLAGQFASEHEVKRFRVEAESAARLDHPNIVPIYEFGELEGRPFLSMRFIDGPNLAKQLHGMPMEPQVIAPLMSTLARAVHYAHQRGILHRDLKPANVLLDSSGQPHVTDFGLAKCLDSTDGLTLSGATLGSPNYMSPEQAAGHPERLTTSADIYSLGAIMYELLTGRAPFRSDTPLETMRKVMEEPPTPPRLLYKFADLELVTICLKCMEKEPARRYGSAEALAEDLERWLRHEPIQARAASGLERLGKWMRRNPKVATLVVLLNLVFLIGVGGILITSVRLASANRAKDRANTQLAKNVRDLEWQKIDELIVSGKRSDALAYLASFLRQNSNDAVAATRLISMLSACNFVMPAAAPLRHATAVSSVAISRDGRRVLTAADDGNVRLWDLPSGTQLQVLPHPNKKTGCYFMPDERFALTSCADSVARLWDLQAGKLVFEFPHGPIVALSENSQLAAFLDSPTNLQVWHLTPPQKVGASLLLPEGFLSANFSPDAQELAVVFDHTIRLWKVGKSEPPFAIFKIPNGTWSRFSPDGKLLATAYGDRIAFLDRKDGTLLKDFRAHDGEIIDMRFTPDSGRLVSMAYDRPFKIWEVPSGRMLGQPLDVEGPLAYCYISADGKRFATRSQTGLSRLWDAFTGLPLSEPFEHQGPVNDLKFTLDDQFIVTASQDGTAQLWDARAGLPETFSLPTTDVYPSACFSRDGRQIYYTSNLQVQIFDIQTRQRLGHPMAHADQIVRMQLSPDGNKLATASFDNSARVWNAKTGAPLTPPLRHTARVYAVTFSPDGKLVATGSMDFSARVWDAETGQTIGPALVHEGDVMHVQFSGDSRTLLTASVDGTARLWSIPNGQLLWPQPLHHKGIVWTAEFSPDGRRIVTASADKSAFVWDAQSGRVLTQPMLHERGICAAHFSPDGSMVLTCSEDGTARVWDSTTGKPISQPMRHKDRLKAGIFSPDGRLVLTGSRDGVVRLWDTRSGYALSEPLRQTGEITGLQFSPNGRNCLSVANLDSINLYDVIVAPPAAPGWFCELVEVVAGKRLNTDGDTEYVPRQSVQSFRERFHDPEQRDFYSRWANWFLHERLKQPVPPFDPGMPK